MPPRLAPLVRAAAASSRTHAPRSARALAGLVGVGVLGAAAYSVDYDRTFAGLSGLRADVYARWVVHCDAAKAPKAVVDGKVDPATSVAHPLTLKPASAPDLALVGVGVRTVSFLKMKVYSAGFYVDSYALGKLKTLPGWKDFDAAALAGPQSEELVQELLDSPAAVAVRVVPVRNTDFGHLRDGLTRTLLARQKAARASGALGEKDDERISAALQDFKGLFPAGSVPKGRQLLLVRSADGHLFLEYEGRVLGGVYDKWVADNMVKAYFAPHNVISSHLRDDVAHTLEERIKA